MATWTTIPDADLTSGKPGKQSIFRALRDNIDAALSGDPSAPKIQSAAFDDNVITGAKLEHTTAGDINVTDSTGTVAITNTSYAKAKELIVGRDGGARIVFTMLANSGGTAYGKIYKNGVAIGTERSTTSSTYVTFSEDFTGFVQGDLIQLYMYRSVSVSADSNSLKFNISNPLEAEVSI